ncbi:heat-inducible transcriptional repressor HrcA [Aneurinibacillus aneurinilyticus]|jgi:heat-inducible transcriptional repressor|uniref:Heat-inducible transcription repressor HrcA n=2 Tax=Aneurinibacillus aneurinilyticus TaxID=1391 RepID=A0A848CXF4_ANEAE|nr:heat-inducible transcriptional repressor HrcA [Aneurinibacillus aneurinilyticus]ERI07982.1 transcription repressor HrcA [Aneurinibacillus aneurinilyticus ATCC 12856]MCI1694363.1 heat-inducible transcriptional repressor HrcA [Aneurinibacillus aneurinilyticus]MED0671543.1 heat-inducible transcriptional repressor HrcA [Aneurinibacillus aneurinilyticus]MED0705384.1 heat-inducible transcriptional repressor HrcA [Aneurinibacillus aneurinilyticus]MED0724997.1 heat-inducible transcriptional repress
MLTERQQMILRAIIDNYIRSAEPVGSRTISKREDIGYSSATIRNEMADLEEMGYLEQPHTSAGRIPSNKGYRFYVDQLARMPFVQIEDASYIRRLFAERFYEFEQVMNQAASILSGLTNYTSIILGHDIKTTRLKAVQMIPLSRQSAVVILVTDTGKVENKTISLPEGMEIEEVERVVNLLNDKLSGVAMTELRQRLHAEVAKELGRYIQQYEQLMTVLEETLKHEPDDHIVLKGTTNILMQPEFRDVDKVRDILTLFEQNEMVVRLFDSQQTGLRVRIGTENEEQAVSGCSIITATYHLDGQPVGTVGILGPTRMEYARVMAILSELSGNLTDAFERFYKNGP